MAIHHRKIYSKFFFCPSLWLFLFVVLFILSTNLPFFEHQNGGQKIALTFCNANKKLIFG